MASASKLNAVHRARQQNLKRVIKEKFAGNTSECARGVGRSHTFMWQLVDGYRGIGEKSARHIEEKLKLVPGSLDTSSTGRIKTAVLKTVPVLMLDALDAKPKTFTPCPLVMEDKAEKMFCTMIVTTDVVELEIGDQVFVDRGDVKLQHRKLYVVRPKGREACVLLAWKEGGAWSLRGTGESKMKPIPEREVRVIGRLLAIVRKLPAAA